MKKVRVTLRPGSTGKKIYLFPSAEALYMWACALDKGEQIVIPDIEELVLDPDGFIEAELRGFDYAYDDGQKFRRFDFIRLGKAQQPKNSSGLLVTIHVGWVSGGLLPMKQYIDSDIEVKVIDDKDAKLDLPTLFSDSDPLPEDVDVDFEEDEHNSDEEDE